MRVWGCGGVRKSEKRDRGYEVCAWILKRVGGRGYVRTMNSWSSRGPKEPIW